MAPDPHAHAAADVIQSSRHHFSLFVDSDASDYLPVQYCLDPIQGQPFLQVPALDRLSFHSHVQMTKEALRTLSCPYTIGAHGLGIPDILPEF